jgi:hypothetical protein
VTTPHGDPPGWSGAAQRLARSLRTGDGATDHTFDCFLPEPLRALSPQYWSPLAVVTQAARWLDDVGVRSVVDIGSGAGKFCVAGALLGRCRFIGLEQRAFLVDSARRLAHLFDVDDRVRFVRGALRAVPIPVGDAYYLFNPFGEYRFGPASRVEAHAETGDQRDADVAAVERLLRRVPVGTWLLTYNGFGGRVPDGYTLVRVDWQLPSPLRLWRKERNASSPP